MRYDQELLRKFDALDKELRAAMRARADVLQQPVADALKYTTLKQTSDESGESDTKSFFQTLNAITIAKLHSTRLEAEIKALKEIRRCIQLAIEEATASVIEKEVPDLQKIETDMAKDMEAVDGQS